MTESQTPSSMSLRVVAIFFVESAWSVCSCPLVMQRCFFQIMIEGVCFCGLFICLVFTRLVQVQRRFLPSFSQWLVDGFYSRLMK